MTEQIRLLGSKRQPGTMHPAACREDIALRMYIGQTA